VWKKIKSPNSKLFLEISGEEIHAQTDVVRTLKAGPTDEVCRAPINVGKILSPQNGSRYSAYYEEAGNFRLCHCDNSTGGCGFPTKAIPGNLTIRGPQDFSVFDSEFTTNIPLAGRATTIEISGISLLPTDRLQFTANSCGEISDFVSDLSRSASPSSAYTDKIIFSNFRFTRGGRFSACFKPAELSDDKYPITVGLRSFLVNGP
jgi:hypothetical protein